MLLYSPGVIASRLTNRSCRREPPDRPTSKAAPRTLSSARSSDLACSTVSRPRKRFGLTPAQR